MPQRAEQYHYQGWKPYEERQRIRKKDLDNRRGSPASRGYDSVWAKTRKAYLKANPLCCFCLQEGITKTAEVVDHIIPISERPDLRLDWSNLRSLCKHHHDQRTAIEQGFAKKSSKPTSTGGG